MYLYGDREVGVIRAYTVGADSLTYAGQEIKLTERGQDVTNHPTGLAWNGHGPTFMGNSIRLNPEGTQWRAVIYCFDWPGLLRTGALDGNLRQTIEDDAAIQGSRPGYVQLQGRWYVATADLRQPRQRGAPLRPRPAGPGPQNERAGRAGAEVHLLALGAEPALGGR